MRIKVRDEVRSRVLQDLVVPFVTGSGYSRRHRETVTALLRGGFFGPSDCHARFFWAPAPVRAWRVDDTLVFTLTWMGEAEVCWVDAYEGDLAGRPVYRVVSADRTVDLV